MSNNNQDNNKTQQQSDGGRGGVAFGTAIAYDDAYGADGTANGMVTSLPTVEEERKLLGLDDDDDIDEEEDEGRLSGSHPSTTAAAQQRAKQAEDAHRSSSDDPFAAARASGSGTGLVNTKIADRESSYHARRHDRAVREDGMSYKDAMVMANLERERGELVEEARRELIDEETGEFKERLDANDDGGEGGDGGGGEEKKDARRRRRRWDDDEEEGGANLITDGENSTAAASKSRWDEDSASSSAAPRRRKRWDETPVVASGAAAPDATPLVNGNATSQKWDETPVVASGMMAATPMIGSSSDGAVASAAAGGRKRSRWDSTPAPSAMQPSATPILGGGGGGGQLLTPLLSSKALSMEKELETRNRPWTDAALDAILPSEGYTLLPPPASYMPLRTPGRKLLAAPTPFGSQTPAGFLMEVPPEEREGQTVQDIREAYGVPVGASSTDVDGEASAAPGALPYIKPEDMQYFGRLMEDVDDESALSKEEAKERQIMGLLLKIKSGTPPQRKTAMRQITDKARFFGAGPLFHQILPLLMSPALEDQERHLLVKVIDRVLYKLDDLVRPYVHRILAVIEPLLIDEDYYARVEGREIISNLAKAAGLSTMISTMRPDIDNPDEYVRNTTSRAFAVVASALGVPSLLPFLKAVCKSRKSWQARHTGIKIVQQIAVLMGCAVLPYLRELVEIVSHGLTDEQAKVRTMAALTVAALAEAAHPYGIESFDSVIRALWKGALEHHGKGLAAFLKAIGFVIPLMEENYASHYTRLVMPILTREFHSPDEEMKRIVLKVVKQCVGSAGVEPDYIRKEILPEFFRNFWIRRMALDRRNYTQVIETTEELANKVGCSDILTRIVDDLKDDSEPYRRMVMETTQKVLENLGSGDIDDRLEERLIDGILYAFQEQAVDAGTNGAFGKEGQIMLDGFGTVVNALGERCKPYLKQIAGTIKWRLNNKAASVRMQAADLIGRIAVVMKACGEEQLMGHLGVVLYEYLGEEYPDVLGSILGALRAIVNVIGMTKMTPPIRDLLPRLTPILRNRHEKVQENCIDLVRQLCALLLAHFTSLICI